MSDETETQSGVEDASSATPSASAPDTADTQAPAPEGDQVASPPDAPAGKEPQDDRSSLLDIVKSAIAPTEPKTPPQGEETKAAEPDATSSPDKQQPDAALEADPTEAELKTMVPHVKRRVEKLLSQRFEARRKVDELTPAAEKWTQFDTYLQKHQLAPEDVNLLLGVGAALRRGDFQAFYDGVMPYVDRARQELGMALPPELQAKVDAGEIAFETAKEFSKTRLANARLEGQARMSQEAAQAAAQQQADAQRSQSISGAVTQWEQRVQSADPDYAKKASTVRRYVQAIMLEEGRPQSPEAGIALAQRAYDEASKLFQGFAPQPSSTRPVPSGARAVNNARAEPNSLMEAAKLGIEQARRARA